MPELRNHAADLPALHFLDADERVMREPGRRIRSHLLDIVAALCGPGLACPPFLGTGAGLCAAWCVVRGAATGSSRKDCATDMLALLLDSNAFATPVAVSLRLFAVISHTPVSRTPS